MFIVFALLLDDALKLAVQLTNGMSNQMLKKFDPLSDDCLLQPVDCHELSMLIDHMLNILK